MKKIDVYRLEVISGGSWRDLADGFCMGMFAGAGLVRLGVISSTGIGASVAGGIMAGCGIYGAFRWYES